jgi:hypothetical protein
MLCGCANRPFLFGRDACDSGTQPTTISPDGEGPTHATPDTTWLPGAATDARTNSRGPRAPLGLARSSAIGADLGLAYGQRTRDRHRKPRSAGNGERELRASGRRQPADDECRRAARARSTRSNRARARARAGGPGGRAGGACSRSRVRREEDPHAKSSNTSSGSSARARSRARRARSPSRRAASSPARTREGRVISAPISAPTPNAAESTPNVRGPASSVSSRDREQDVEVEAEAREHDHHPEDHDHAARAPDVGEALARPAQTSAACAARLGRAPPAHQEEAREDGEEAHGVALRSTSRRPDAR